MCQCVGMCMCEWRNLWSWKWLCATPTKCWQQNPGSLQEQYAFLTAKLFLQPQLEEMWQLHLCANCQELILNYIAKFLHFSPGDWDQDLSHPGQAFWFWFSSLVLRLGTSMYPRLVQLPQNPECWCYRHVLPYLVFQLRLFSFLQVAEGPSELAG